MKIGTIIILLSCITSFSFSQQKTAFGISTEGSWFMPKGIGSRDWATKNGFGAGIGLYASRNLFWIFSADIGLGYRYKQMKQHYVIYIGGGGYFDSYEAAHNAYTSSGDGIPYHDRNVRGWDELSLHHIIVPLRLQMLLSKNFFIRGGIESTWLMNYDVVNEKPELNWTIGFGSQKHKLKWSVNYIEGFKEQGLSNRTQTDDGRRVASINTNRMVQLQLSYPIGQFRF